MNTLDIKYHLLELVKLERSLGNSIIDYRECNRCGFPFVTEEGSGECIVCSGKLKPLHTVKISNCPICGTKFDSGGKTACSPKCIKKSNRLGIKRKDRLKMISKGLVIPQTYKHGGGVNPGWKGKQHPWKSGQEGSFGNL